MRTVPLRRLARVVNGGTPTSDPENWGGGISWATPVDLAKADAGSISTTDRNLTPRGVATGSAVAPVDSVLVSTRAPIGYTARVEREMAFNQGCKAVVPLSASLDSRFLQYALISQTDSLKAAGSGSTFLELSTDALARHPVPLCEPGQQQRVADFLDDRVARIDRIIAARREQLALHAQARKAALDDLIRDAGPVQRVSRTLELAAVGVVVNPSSYFQAEGVPFVHGFNVRDGFLDLANLKRMSAEDSATLSRSMLKRGDVLVVRAGYPGRAAVVPIDLAGGNCASVLLLRPGPALAPEWLAAFFNSPYGRSQVEQAQYGAAQGVINLHDVLAFSVPLPDRPVQAQGLSRLAEFEQELCSGSEVTRRQLDLLTEYKQSLITAAVTGELDVTTAGSGVPG